MEDSIGLVLCGGGGKGAFHIGVWEALKKNNIYEKITCIAGTSVGALNAVLMAIGDFDLANQIWRDISPSDMLTPDFSSKKCIFSRKGMLNIFKKVPFEKLQYSKIKVYVTIWNKTKKLVEYRMINNLSIDEIKKVLLASSAIPIAYPPVVIDNQEFMDAGGIEFFNTPVEPLYNEGMKNIWIITLNCSFRLNSIKNKRCVVDAEVLYQQCEFKVINPLYDLGLLFRGTLNFTPENILKLKNYGYIDASRIIKGDYKAMKNAHIQNNINLEKIIKENFTSEIEFEDFISKTGMPGNHQTCGGKIFWKNVLVFYGYKIQQHTALNVLKNHYRILDQNDKCVLYTYKFSELYYAIYDYVEEKNKLNQSN